MYFLSMRAHSNNNLDVSYLMHAFDLPFANILFSFRASQNSLMTLKPKKLVKSRDVHSNAIPCNDRSKKDHETPRRAIQPQS